MIPSLTLLATSSFASHAICLPRIIGQAKRLSTDRLTDHLQEIKVGNDTPVLRYVIPATYVCKRCLCTGAILIVTFRLNIFSYSLLVSSRYMDSCFHFHPRFLLFDATTHTQLNTLTYTIRHTCTHIRTLTHAITRFEFPPGHLTKAEQCTVEQSKRYVNNKMRTHICQM